MNKKIRISDLCSDLDEKLYEELEITNMTDLHPSKSNIEKLVADGLRNQAAAPKRRRLKPLKTLLVAAVICLSATTVFAAAGGFQYFKSIFGDSVENVQSAITSPMISVQNEGQKLSLEGMLTDGYTIDLILSLEDLSGKGLPAACFDETIPAFQSYVEPADSQAAEERFLSVTYNLLPEFQTDSKVFYHLTASSLESCSGSELNVAFLNNKEQLAFSVPVDGSISSAEYTINQSTDGNYTLETIQLSPLGVLLIGREAQASGGLPTPVVSVQFKDGSVEELMSALSFDAGNDGETVIGGGGAVISDDPLSGPLVVSTSGTRNPEGKVVTKGEFSRFINLDQVQSVWVNGTEYAAPVKETTP